MHCHVTAYHSNISEVRFSLSCLGDIRRLAWTAGRLVCITRQAWDGHRFRYFQFGLLLYRSK